MAHIEMKQWKVICTVVVLDELEVEVLTCINSEDFHVCICKGLAKADSATSIEGCKGVRIALLAGRCETQLIVRIEPLWSERVRIAPFVSVAAQIKDVDTDLSARFDVVLTNFLVSTEDRLSCLLNRWAPPEGLLDDLVEIV